MSKRVRNSPKRGPFVWKLGPAQSRAGYDRRKNKQFNRTLRIDWSRVESESTHINYEYPEQDVGKSALLRFPELLAEAKAAIPKDTEPVAATEPE